MQISDYQRIYCSGIGGIGVSALAQLLHADGAAVMGSDLTRSGVTTLCEEKGITVIYHQDATEIPVDMDLLIYSDAVPENHPERLFARQHNIPQMSYFEALGLYMREFDYAIAVSGTHGKTTTTALIGNIFVAAGMDPTVVVGSIVSEFESNARVGSKKIIIVEACEHNSHMLQLYPNMIVLTNIEADHLDYYRDLEHIVDTFQEYVHHLPNDGVLIRNADDPASANITTDARVISYGIESRADHMATDKKVVAEHTHFMSSGSAYTLAIPGTFNIFNALGAIAAARFFEIEETIIQQAVASFRGVWRRFEYINEYHGARIFSDYAHHPTAVRGTIQAARDFFPEQRIVVVFQPHQRARTKKLFPDFVTALASGDVVIVQEIYDVAGRESSDYAQVSSRDLVEKIEETGARVSYSSDADATRTLLEDTIQAGDIVLIMGAGDMYQFAESFL